MTSLERYLVLTKVMMDMDDNGLESQADSIRDNLLDVIWYKELTEEDKKQIARLRVEFKVYGITKDKEDDNRVG